MIIVELDLQMTNSSFAFCTRTEFLFQAMIPKRMSCVYCIKKHKSNESNTIKLEQTKQKNGFF